MKKAAFGALALGLVVALSVTQSCKKDSNSTLMKTLYDSLGGTTMVKDPANTSTMIEQGRLGLRSVVDSTIFVIAGDAAINGHFSVLLMEVGAGNTTGFMALSKKLTDFFAVATGAKNYTYNGLNMVAAHDPAQNTRMKGKATAADFDAFVNDLVKGAKKNGLPDYLINRVGAIVGTLKSSIVQM